MTKEEYDKQASQAVEIIKSLNGIVGTQFNSAEFDQRFDDTDNLIHALEIFQLHISECVDENGCGFGHDYSLKACKRWIDIELDGK